MEDAWEVEGRETYIHDDVADRSFLINLAPVLRREGWRPHPTILRAFRHSITGEIIEIEIGGIERAFSASLENRCGLTTNPENQKWITLRFKSKITEKTKVNVSSFVNNLQRIGFVCDLFSPDIQTAVFEQ